MALELSSILMRNTGTHDSLAGSCSVLRWAEDNDKMELGGISYLNDNSFWSVNEHGEED